MVGLQWAEYMASLTKDFWGNWPETLIRDTT